MIIISDKKENYCTYEKVERLRKKENQKYFFDSSPPKKNNQTNCKDIVDIGKHKNKSIYFNIVHSY